MTTRPHPMDLMGGRVAAQAGAGRSSCLVFPPGVGVLGSPPAGTLTGQTPCSVPVRGGGADSQSPDPAGHPGWGV